MLQQLHELRAKQNRPLHELERRLLASHHVSVILNYPAGVHGHALELSHELELREAYDELTSRSSV